jgi:hypothetical protein
MTVAYTLSHLDPLLVELLCFGSVFVRVPSAVFGDSRGHITAWAWRGRTCTLVLGYR